MRSCRQGLFPTLDSVVYNNSILNRNTQENPIFTLFLVSLQHLSTDNFVSTVSVFLCSTMKNRENIWLILIVEMEKYGCALLQQTEGA